MEDKKSKKELKDKSIKTKSSKKTTTETVSKQEGTALMNAILQLTSVVQEMKSNMIELKKESDAPAAVTEKKPDFWDIKKQNIPGVYKVLRVTAEYTGADGTTKLEKEAYKKTFMTREEAELFCSRSIQSARQNGTKEPKLQIVLLS